MKTLSVPAFPSVRARDLMRADVTSLSPDDTIESALATFEELRISGAPVLDATGRLLGVLSLSDIARPEHTAEDLLQTKPRGFELADESEGADDALPGEVFFAKEDYSSEIRGRELVCDWMNEELISVRPDADLVEVCTAMVDQGIHRVFVCEGTRLLGVITSFDVMRCVAQSRRPAARKGR